MASSLQRPVCSTERVEVHVERECPDLFGLDPTDKNVSLNLRTDGGNVPFFLNTLYSKFVLFLLDAPPIEKLHLVFVLFNSDDQILGVFTRQFYVPDDLGLKEWYWEARPMSHVSFEEHVPYSNEIDYVDEPAAEDIFVEDEQEK